jgi:hypothetical protein
MLVVVARTILGGIERFPDVDLVINSPTLAMQRLEPVPAAPWRPEDPHLQAAGRLAAVAELDFLGKPGCIEELSQPLNLLCAARRDDIVQVHDDRHVDAFIISRVKVCRTSGWPRQ